MNDAAPSDQFELIASVEKAYADYDRKKINHVFLTLQACLNMIIEDQGGNNYKIPHMGKAKLERLGILPTVLQVTGDAYPYL